MHSSAIRNRRIKWNDQPVSFTNICQLHQDSTTYPVNMLTYRASCITVARGMDVSSMKIQTKHRQASRRKRRRIDERTSGGMTEATVILPVGRIQARLEEGQNGINSQAACQFIDRYRGQGRLETSCERSVTIGVLLSWKH